MKITEIITNEGLMFDRYLGSAIVLPHPDFNTVKIQPNDIATAKVINLAFQKIYENFLYLYKSSRIASNIIPVSSTAIGGVSSDSTNFKWYTYNEGLSSDQFIPLSNASLYNQDNITNIAAAYNKDTTAFTIFTTSNNDIVAYKTDRRFFTSTIDKDTSITVALSTKEIYQNSGVAWKQVTDFVFGENNTMFVLDTSANRVVKYDASGFLTDNTILQDRLVYVDSMGGFGDYTDQSFFNSPQSIDTYKSHLYVLDSGNGCVKQFDQDLNWVTTYRLFRDFLSAYPVQLSHDSDGNMYVLTDQTKILKYDNNFQNKTELYLDTSSASGEFFKKIIFSATDKNIFYVLSNKHVYKYLVNQPKDQIGKYLPYLYRFNTDETNVDFVSLPGSNNTGDYNILFSSNNGAGKFSVWYDNLNLFDVLSLPDFDVYTLDEINVSSDEYLQSWVFNKALSKLIINHMRLRDQIIGKFLARKDVYGNITFRGTRYFLPAELANLVFQQDLTYFIGMNEIFQNTIVNRCLEKLFNIQTALAKALAAEIYTDYNISETLYIN